MKSQTSACVLLPLVARQAASPPSAEKPVLIRDVMTAPPAASPVSCQEDGGGVRADTITATARAHLWRGQGKLALE